MISPLGHCNYSYIHICLNYANLSLGSTNRSNLKRLLSQQKHAVQIINNTTCFDHTSELSVAVFMYQTRKKTPPLIFSGRFERISLGYPTNFSQFNYKIPKPNLTKANSESHVDRAFHLEWLSTEFWKKKKNKKKLNHFRSLHLNWNLKCFLLAMKLYTF